MLTKKQAFKLKPGDILIDQRGKRWRVNGKVQTWKRSPERIRIPLKHGLYDYDYLSENEFDEKGNCDLATKGE